MNDQARHEGKFPLSYYNWISILGAYTASVAILMMILFLGISFFFSFAANPYLGIVQYILLPLLMVAGLIMVPAGAYVRRRRIRRLGQVDRRRWPRIDFNRKSHRNALTVFAFGSVVVIFVSAVGSYQTFHYTESVAFCGETCHTVMHPEYTAYKNSPHARVRCVDCHIGPGASFWVESKLSGAYQVYAVIVNNYPRPIPTPVKSLRPAQETCEQCHWPAEFFGGQQQRFFHFMYDSANTAWPINMLIKTGGGDPATGQAHGIHWHMNIENKVEYIARGEKRQDIAWVRMTDRTTDAISIYNNKDNPMSKEEIDTATVRVMDCMDCHNRPSHIFNSPDYAVDLLLLTQKVDSTLPDIKRIAVEAMAKKYKTSNDARAGIATLMADFYQVKYPEIFEDKQAEIDAAIEAVQRTFSQNIFPDMNVRWTDYPTNLGHFLAPGCFRCHNSSMVSETGESVSTECNTCHVIMAQGSGENRQVSSIEAGLEFQHPVDIGGAWQEIGCFNCHTGVQP